MLRTIVVGVDGSTSSMNALRYAADLAADLDDAEIVVVFARHIYVAMPEHVAEDLYSDVLDRAAQSVLATARAELVDRELRWKFEVHDAAPANVLGEVAERVGASLLVIGRSGWSAIHEVVLGSVSNRLAHQPDWPVLLVS